MRKKVTKTKEYETEEYYCDLCGNPFNKGICGNTMHVCKVCNRDICGDCAIIDDYFAWADDRAVVCKHCDKITKPFKFRLDNIEEEYDIKRKQIWNEFKQTAEENFKKLNVIK